MAQLGGQVQSRGPSSLLGGGTSSRRSVRKTESRISAEPRLPITPEAAARAAVLMQAVARRWLCTRNRGARQQLVQRLGGPVRSSSRAQTPRPIWGISRGEPERDPSRGGGSPPGGREGPTDARAVVIDWTRARVRASTGGGGSRNSVREMASALDLELQGQLPVTSSGIPVARQKSASSASSGVSPGKAEEPPPPPPELASESTETVAMDITVAPPMPPPQEVHAESAGEAAANEVAAAMTVQAAVRGKQSRDTLAAQAAAKEAAAAAGEEPKHAEILTSHLEAERKRSTFTSASAAETVDKVFDVFGCCGGKRRQKRASDAVLAQQLWLERELQHLQ